MCRRKHYGQHHDVKLHLFNKGFPHTNSFPRPFFPPTILSPDKPSPFFPPPSRPVTGGLLGISSTRPQPATDTHARSDARRSPFPLRLLVRPPRRNAPAAIVSVVLRIFRSQRRIHLLVGRVARRRRILLLVGRVGGRRRRVILLLVGRVGRSVIPFLRNSFWFCLVYDVLPCSGVLGAGRRVQQQHIFRSRSIPLPHREVLDGQFIPGAGGVFVAVLVVPVACGWISPVVLPVPGRSCGRCCQRTRTEDTQFDVVIQCKHHVVIQFRTQFVCGTVCGTVSPRRVRANDTPVLRAPALLLPAAAVAANVVFPETEEETGWTDPIFLIEPAANHHGLCPGRDLHADGGAVVGGLLWSSRGARHGPSAAGAIVAHALVLVVAPSLVAPRTIPWDNRRTIVVAPSLVAHSRHGCDTTRTAFDIKGDVSSCVELTKNHPLTP